jgi:large repetitive protein
VRSVRIACFAAIALLSPLAVAQNGSIAGHVVNAQTGDFIAGATIRLFPLTVRTTPDSPTASTQADGSFRFDSLRPGQYMLLPEKDGFVAPPGRALPTVNVSSDLVSPDVQIPLLPAGGIAGKVTNQDGMPVPGARVQAFFVPQTGRIARLQASRAESTTDKEGHYLLFKLDPGNYFLLAAPDVKGTRQRADGYSLVDTFFPEGLSIDEATPLTVAAGQSTAADIKLRNALTYRIEGKLAEQPPGMATKSLLLEIAPSSELGLHSLSRSISLNPDLSFSVQGVVPGRYQLVLTTSGAVRRVGRHLLARQEVELGSSDIIGLVLRPTPPITLTGTVTLQTPHSVPLAGVSVRAVPLDDGSRNAFGGAAVAADGTFKLTNLEPAPYVIIVQPAQQGLYVSSLTLNQRDILNQPVDLSDSPGGQLAAVLSTGTGQIAGTVSEAPSMVVVVPQQLAPDASNVRVVNTQENNSTFSAQNLPPGDYLLYAAERANRGVWLNPLFLQAIQNLGVPVHLDESGNQSVELNRTAEPLLRDQALRLGLNFP